jgi:hypothetical protein
VKEKRKEAILEWIKSLDEKHLATIEFIFKFLPQGYQFCKDKYPEEFKDITLELFIQSAHNGFQIAQHKQMLGQMGVQI